MYQEQVALPALPGDFRQQVLTAGEFDWGKVNPDIFGAMFQQLVDLDELRKNGEHYTSEENIQKVIEPLFLDEYRQRFQDAYNDRTKLLQLQEELAGLQFMDPACGSGNFLIQAYKHLRGLEYELITRAERLELEEIQAQLAEIEHQRLSKNKKALIARRDELQAGAALQFDEQVLRKSKLSMRQFYGIEINAWPAKVAATSMLLVDHLANQAWGENVVRLPIEETPQIVHGNALRVDWEEVIPHNGNATYVFGNPPFIGQYTKTDEQTADMKHVWGKDYDGYLDYVTGWHKKSLDFYHDRSGEFAFVTTNSITHGQPVPALFGPIFQAGWSIKFAHRAFAWDSEAAGKAAVHCVIVGFSKDHTVKPRLWDYPHVKGPAVEQTVTQGINAYLIDGPNVLVTKRSRVLSPLLGKVVYGSKPVDGGHLVPKAEISRPEHDPIAMKYVRYFVGAKELINGTDRWCFWMAGDNFTSEDVTTSPVLKAHVEGCRDFRKESKKAATQELANTPHLFAEIRPTTENYLAIPAHVSENRPYFLAQRFGPDVICGNANFQVEDPDGLQFGLISSSMFITWQRAVGGRLGSSLRFANTLTWNTFPVPALDEKQRQTIIDGGMKVLEARALHPDRSLADHYNPLTISPELLDAHRTLDEAVDAAFGAPRLLKDEKERLEVLFARYAEMTG